MTHRPSLEEAARIALERFGIAGQVSALPGEIDANFLLTPPEDRLGTSPKIVLRISPADADLDVLDLQIAAMQHVQSATTPSALASVTGNLIERLPDTSGWARAITYLPGSTYLAAGRPTDHASTLGQAVGSLTAALADFRHRASDRVSNWDLTRASTVIEQRIGEIDGHRARDQIRRILTELHGHEGTLARLPRQVIHGDPNDLNILVRDGAISGIIDFGDVMRSIRVGDVVIAATYAMFDQDDPLTVAGDVIRGFCTAQPLMSDEAQLIYPLIRARLAVSVSMSASRGGNNPHHTVSEVGAWDLIERLDEVDVEVATAELAQVAGHGSGVTSPGVDLMQDRVRRFPGALSLAYAEPLTMLKGRGTHLFDNRGRRYLDCVNNVCHVGHANPRVVGAAAEQMYRLNTNTRYLHPNLVEYARRLSATLPESLEVCVFVNSGSEANELALRMARAATGGRQTVVFDHGYHGNSTGTIDISPYKFNGPGGSGAPDWVHVAPLPDEYRRPFRGGDATSTYRTAVDQLISEIDGPLAGVITESIVGCGGQILPEPGVLAELWGAVKNAGGVAIADEVQVGFGRVGSSFWGFELHDVVPDIVTMGKPMGNGHPLGAVVTTRTIANAFSGGMEYFNTFGGNPVSCAVGLAVLDEIRDRDLQANALRIGTHVRDGLSALQDNDRRIGDVRGAGLFLGVELVTHPDTREPAPLLATQVVEFARSNGVLLSIDGPHHNVLKIKPPLTFSLADGDRLIHTLGRAFAEAGHG